MFKAQIIGNIGNDAKVQTTNGRTAINFSIANNRKWKDSTGTPHEEVKWINCTFWRDNGQSTKIVEYLKKGTQVFVEGIPSWKIYQGAQGPAIDFRITVSSIELLGSKSEPAGEAAPQTGTHKTNVQTPPPDAGPDHEYYSQPEGNNDAPF